MLPLGYIELEYLQSTGSQWIDTGVMSGNGIEVETSILATSNNYNDQMFGSYANSSRQVVGIISLYNINYWQFGVNSPIDLTSYPISFNTWYKVVASWKTSSCRLYVDDVLLCESSTTMSSNGVNFALFARMRTATTVEKGFRGKLKATTIKVNDTLVRSFIPAKRASDGVLGMYDLVTNTFFTNQGSGTFIAGPIKATDKVTSIKDIVVKPILPSGYKRLEYIEGVGRQYINTEIVPSMDMRILYKSKDIEGGQTERFHRHLGNYSPKRFYPLYQNWENNNRSLYCVDGYTYSPDTFVTSEVVVVDFNWGSDGAFRSTVTSDTQVSTVSGVQDATFSQPMFLFGLNNNGSLYTVYTSKNRVFYCTIWKSGSLVRNFVPSQRLSDNAIGMYDLVSNTFFTNRGTGSFTAGPEVSNYESIQSIQTIIRL